ncbi:C4-dicarboxylate ABC transporter substrate-binding protein [Paramagnetospirillum kuznetsovii]|uniref:C4-dicarboxylate ABC transporter substrate-binding protein n=1 Tax=Paramagnetospirillum kuznetsovii TaxID=2053833 RepID=A0A364NXY2_9PROT|nr:DctP family TRAP transporter solute-binding subunit [Paramagnetospirillum kuznetsovii]RAU21926.1 C4-dicarboxylate ABC transporter substrate-binding protein [Paramagnetospirillum kuznetsovii]
MRFLVSLALFCLTAVGPLRAETVFYLAHANRNDGSDVPTAAAAITFKEVVERESGGTIRVEIFPEGQLGGDASVMSLIRKGIAQGAIISVGGLKNIYPQIGVLDYPFAWKSLEDTYKVFDGPFMDRLRDDFTKRTGLYLAGFADTGGLFVLSNSRHAIHGPADLQGLKIRTMGITTHKIIVRALGAEPVELPWNELPPALRTGVVDGQMNPASIIRFGKLYEVQKYVTLTNHLYTPYPWVISADFLAKLEPAQRDAIDKGVRDGIRASRALAANHRDDLTKLGENMMVTILSPAEHEAFRRKTQPAFIQAIAESLGEEGSALLNGLILGINAR